MDQEGDGPNGKFFPSSVQTKDGNYIPSDYFLKSQACERCHSDIYKQWQSSMHHFSSFNNQWYRKSIEYMQEVDGVKQTKWCAGCHDPALALQRHDGHAYPAKHSQARSQRRPQLHDVPQHRSGEKHHGPGRFRSRISKTPRTRRQRKSRRPRASRFHGPSESRAASPRLPKTFHARASPRILLRLPQSPSRPAVQQLPLAARLQRIRQLASQRRLRPGSPRFLLPGNFDDVRRLPHAARPLQRRRQSRRLRPLSPLSRRQHRSAHRQRRLRATRSQPQFPARQTTQRGYFRHLSGFQKRILPNKFPTIRNRNSPPPSPSAKNPISPLRTAPPAKRVPSPPLSAAWTPPSAAAMTS